MSRPPVLILHASGTNRDREAAWACELAGGKPDIVHMNRLIAGEVALASYRMLVLPGGFSYGDDLGAGKLWASALRYCLADDLADFVARGRPVLGICNGFQSLVKAGLLPGLDGAGGAGSKLDATLARNDSGQFECRWVYLQPDPASACVFTAGLEELIHCPVAHGEGKFMARNEPVLAQIEALGLVALRYVGPDGGQAAYPWNPNGSQNAIAGVCNPQGNVLGLMPHPEDHIVPRQHRGYHRGECGMAGLPLFANGIRRAGEL